MVNNEAATIDVKIYYTGNIKRINSIIDRKGGEKSMLSYILTSHSRRHYHNNASCIRSIKNAWPPILGGILCIQK